MLFGRLKSYLKLIKDNLTSQQIIQKRKQLIDEFCDQTDFGLPESTLAIKTLEDKIEYN